MIMNSIFLENMHLSKTPVLTELKYQHNFFVNMIDIGLVLYQIQMKLQVM